MVEFRFDIRPLFPQPIIKVTSNLLPHTFRGDRRQALDATSKMSEIIDRLGQLSAAAQKLTKPVTTAQRLRMSENQIIYLLADVNAGHNGIVIGLLKVGTKDLYLFDETGQTQKVSNAPCILDFYIHESRQRAGLGKDLFETMLAEEHWLPIKCSVDRPSEKLLGFLRKHYGLVKAIPQANNFVLYEGFFDHDNDKSPRKLQSNGMYITNSPNTQLFGAHYLGDDINKKRMRQLEASNLGAQITQISPVGRYGAPRPTCSMAEIIHSNSTPNKGGAESSSLTQTHYKNDAVEAITEDLQKLHTAIDQLEEDVQSVLSEAGDVQTAEEIGDDVADALSAVEEITEEAKVEITQTGSPSKTPSISESISSVKKTTTFHLSKQHTGMKNRSHGVGMAVTPTNKMEFNQEAPEDFGVVKINRPVAKVMSPSNDNADAMSTVSSGGEGLTDQGYYDLKFYHNKLW